MNDKDKEAFEKWWDEIRLRGQSTFGIVAITWKAACEYKQKEIDSIDCYIERDEKIKKLQAENARLSIIIANQKTVININQTENAKLRECVKFYADLDNEVDFYDSRGMSYARQVLKELNEE